jgi:hypothetical protein
VKLQVFSMRSMASGAAFLEAHELAFAYFDGVFRRLRYDNLSSAVKKILRGQQRELTARFIAFRSQYQVEFCTPSEGHEKAACGRSRLLPSQPLGSCAGGERSCGVEPEAVRGLPSDESRIVSGRTETVGTRLLAEKEHLLPLAADVFDLAEVSFPRVDQTGCAKVRTNSYSVPLKPGSIVHLSPEHRLSVVERIARTVTETNSHHNSHRRQLASYGHNPNYP